MRKLSDLEILPKMVWISVNQYCLHIDFLKINNNLLSTKMPTIAKNIFVKYLNYITLRHGEPI